jgi:hypothetical protein
MKTMLIACLALVCLPAQQGTRLVEPQQVFVLAGNGKECELRVGEPVVLPREFEGQKVTLRVRPTRLFDYQGLRFRYPQNFSWYYESKESGGEFVTLSGRTTVLQLSFYNDRVAAQALVESTARAIADKLGPRAATRVCVLIGNANRVLEGKHVEVTVSGQTSTQEVFALRLGDLVATLVVQDTLTDSGKPDPETEALLKLFADSLEWTK